MASLKTTRSSKYARRGLLEDEPPDHVESTGELLIKQLVQKQTNTSVTLDQQLREEKKFERGIGFVALDQFAAGTSTLQQFEERHQQAEKMRELEGRGLKRGEALALVRGVRESKAIPAAQAAMQECINQQLHAPSTECKAMRKQEWELALSLKPNSMETRLYQFAMRNASAKPQADPRPPDHPVHHLAEMEQSLLHTADPQSLARTFRRKRRQQLEALAEPQWVHFKAPDRQHSLWDTIERPIIVKKKPHKEKIVVTCKKQTMYTIRGGEIVEHDSENTKVVQQSRTRPRCQPSGQAYVVLQTLNVNPEVSGRITEEEIMQLPRFKNYERGKVSKILYIKNLSSKVTEEDLAAVFNQFQESNEEKIIFRLMTGKMKEQAFITFTSCEKATEALEGINGIILKGKPMVIQYGRQHD